MYLITGDGCIPNISFLLPWTISFPAILTKENFNCFPIFTTWLQFSTFLNGNLIGGLVASFQLTIPGDTLSRASSSTHLRRNTKFISNCRMRTCLNINQVFLIERNNNIEFSTFMQTNWQPLFYTLISNKTHIQHWFSFIFCKRGR